MNYRKLLTTDQLLVPGSLNGQVDNSAFLPVRDAGPAHRELELSFDIAATRMKCNHQGVVINGEAIDLFPAARFRLDSVDDELVPLERDLLRDESGNGYWDLSLSPGRIWSEEEDGRWSRAALPFQLSNIFENDTHHGIATFLYNETEISPIFYQVVAETKTFLCPGNLQAWGWLEASVGRLAAGTADANRDAYRNELRDQHPLKPLADWRSDSTAAHFEDIETGFGSDSTMISGLVIDDEIYASPARSSMGDYPYPRGLKFGIWSATKTAFCSLACLRIAQITGQDPRSSLVRDLLPEASENPGWETVTIGHCLDMASGIGSAVSIAEPAQIFADYLLEEYQSRESDEALESYNRYHEWFLAPSQLQKNIAAFSCDSYPWSPGTVARYRDQDLYVAGAALDAFLKLALGPEARIWDMLRDEVYRPAGIHHAIKFHTIETDRSKEVPLSDAGLLLSMDNIAGLGKLILDGGQIGNEQILHAAMLDDFFNPRYLRGLPTGIQIDDGEVHYYAGIWRLPYRARNGELLWIPSMRGYGGQIIQTLPNGMTTFRFGFDSYDTEERYDALKLVKLADALRPF